MKDLEPPRDPIEAMGEAYERLLETAMEELHEAEEKSGPVLHRLIDRAKEKLLAAEEFTEEELDKVSDYLKRDLIDAADYLVETGSDLATWLGFDIALIEERLKEMFFKAADQTTIELEKLKLEAERAGYRTGEITGPGTLVCDACGEELHFHRVGRIPPCPKCNGTHFHRKPPV